VPVGTWDTGIVGLSDIGIVVVVVVVGLPGTGIVGPSTENCRLVFECPVYHPGSSTAMWCAVAFPVPAGEAVQRVHSAVFGEMGQQQNCRKIHSQGIGIGVEHEVVHLRAFFRMQQQDQMTCAVPAV